MVWEIIFWLAVISIIHSYLLFPLLLILLASFRKPNDVVYGSDEELPFVSILMAVHNEELVLVKKLRSVFNSEYPEDRFEMLVGSDHSTDRSNEILRIYSNDCKSLRFYSFDERQGKPAIINSLYKEAKGEILILTDANVFFRKDTIFQLVKHFENKKIGLVAGNIVNSRTTTDGVSIPEWTFLSREIRTKYNEGRIWGATIGAEGGCYAIRNELFNPVPKGFAVDDFYITMKVLEKRYDCILELEAVGYENVSNSMAEAFRRKIRISSGNFQNLRTFKRLLWPPWTGRAFSFFSHKVLRWFGPFFLLTILLTNILIGTDHIIYLITLITQLSLFTLLIIDFLLRKIRFHIVLLRFITHFFSMNLALLLGFFKFLKRSETDVWEPTKRTKAN